MSNAYARQGLAYLQNGEEAQAREALNAALHENPKSGLARTLLSQIDADPQEVLGQTFIEYTVKPSDTLSTIAQRYLKDRLQLYLLAKYNDIENPKRGGSHPLEPSAKRISPVWSRNVPVLP